ncbi:MAG: tetratricopeptide repeat protein [Endomicrobiales bacterium]
MSEERIRKIREYEGILASGPLSPAAALELGKLYRHEGRLAEAETLFARCLELEPSNAPAHFELGNVSAARGDQENALLHLEEALRLDPSHSGAAIELAKILARKKEYPKARELFEKAALAQPENPAPLIELGKISRIQGDHGRSLKALEKALSLDPGNTALKSFLAKAGDVKGARKETLPCRIFFTWGLHYCCNYKCSYCYTPKPDQKDFPGSNKYHARYPGTEKVIKAWERVYEKYGSCRIRLDGGEPSIYPDFIPLVQNLSRLHWLQINTNLSFGDTAFLEAVEPGRVRVDASFHSEYVPVEEFKAKVRRLRDRGFKVVVAFVAYPPFVDRIREYKAAFEHMQVPFIIHPFSGEYQGRKYPAGYTPDETGKIYGIDRESRTELTWRKEKQENTAPKEAVVTAAPRKEETVKSEAPAPAAPLRKACRMGQMYARIYPNGDAYRCCTDDGLLSLGNLFDGNFSLLDEAAPCAHAGCRCWRCMVVGDEDRWLHTWMDDWEMP